MMHKGNGGDAPSLKTLEPIVDDGETSDETGNT